MVSASFCLMDFFVNVCKFSLRISRIKMQAGRSACCGERKEITSGLNVKWITRKYRDRDLLNLAGNRSYLQWERNRLTQFFGFLDIKRPSIIKQQRWARDSNRNIDRSINRSTNRSIKVSNCNPHILRPRSRPVLKDMSRPISTLMPDWHLTRLITNGKKRGRKEKGVEQLYILHMYI